MYQCDTSNTQGEAPGGPHPLPVNSFPLSSTVSPSSNSKKGAPSLNADVGDSDNPSSGFEDKFAHLSLTPKQQYITPSSSERTQKLKALPGCQNVKAIGLESIALWRKSFELTDQEFLFHDLQPVESLKKKTNGELVQNQFEALANFSASIKSCFVGFQELRKPFDDLVSAKNTTVTRQVEAAIKLRQELKENATTLGKNGNIILDCHSDIWKFQRTSVKETQDQIESMLFAEQDYQEDVQFRLDLLKDGERIAPKIREPSGLATAFLEGVGKYGLLKLAKRYKKKWLGSKLQQDTYEREKSKADSLDQKLNESRDCLYQADTTWLDLNMRIYSNSFVIMDKVFSNDPNVTFVAIANELDETEGKLVTLIELIEEFLAQITQEYGLKFCTREVKRLCSRIPNIFIALEMLLSAKEVVVDDHQYIYEEHIYKLCKAVLEHFNVMKEVHWECRIAVNAERQAAFLRDDVPKFQNGVAPHLQAIMDIAQAHISKAKSKDAYKKRAKDDRHHGDSGLARPGRSLVTGDEILWALYKVIDALLLIHMVSGSSNASDKTASGTEDTTANGPLAWFEMPDEMINQFYAVLFGEVRKLEFLKDQGERLANERLNSNGEPEPEGHLSRLRCLMTRNPH